MWSSGLFGLASPPWQPSRTRRGRPPQPHRLNVQWRSLNCRLVAPENLPRSRSCGPCLPSTLGLFLSTISSLSSVRNRWQPVLSLFQRNGVLCSGDERLSSTAAYQWFGPRRWSLKCTTTPSSPVARSCSTGSAHRTWLPPRPPRLSPYQADLWSTWRWICLKTNLRYATLVLCHKSNMWLGELRDLTPRRVWEQWEKHLDIPEIDAM